MLKLFLPVISIFLFLPSLAAPTRSDYEQKAISEGLELYDLEIQTDTDNKTIEKIYIYTRSPFLPDAKALRLLNYLHINSKDRLIKSLIFLKEGDPYRGRVQEDSEKNLRRGRTRSLVAIVPVKKKGVPEKGQVSVLVVTQDAFSLTPNLDFKWSSDTLNRFSFFLAEENLFGLNKILGAGYELNQGHHEAKIEYKDKYFWQTSWQIDLVHELFWLRQEKKLDGFSLGASLKKPLLSETDKWGLRLDGAYQQVSKIDFVGNKIRKEKLADNGREISRFFRMSEWQIAALITRSFGIAHKQEISFGHSIGRKKPAIPKQLDLSAKESQLFREKILPKNEFESYAVVGLDLFENRFLYLYDYDTYALKESIQLGYAASFSANLSYPPVMFGDFGFVRPKVGFSYRKDIGNDGFITAAVKSSQRLTKTRQENLKHSVELTLTSPHIGKWGRLIIFSGLFWALKDRDNKQIILGTQEGLRGVPSRFYRGQRAFRHNTEFRTTSKDIWIAKAGLVAFYDAGSAFDTWERVNPTHAVGIGLRMLWPQLGTQVMRMDIAFPFYGEGRKYNSWLLSFGLGQAF